MEERFNVEYSKLKNESEQKYDALNREWDFR